MKIILDGISGLLTNTVTNLLKDQQPGCIYSSGPPLLWSARTRESGLFFWVQGFNQDGGSCARSSHRYQRCQDRRCSKLGASLSLVACLLGPQYLFQAKHPYQQRTGWCIWPPYKHSDKRAAKPS
ncbi:uncharacterized protein LOC101824127 isoform X4 [Mesocricetus auratus]|uniref:Uncharacterized protein LOC101824127 isoform X4 n=1 Tax=Mesocricetus auratus TaxID=10036 RepID=A0ABM2XN95_MESAU|nr:uncharacterized protein LOC101824127 isoform X4 [Mesocricetus auratus]